MAKKTETRPGTATINPFGLRMQPELREVLEAAASESGRSLNAEIVARLEQSEQFAADKRRMDTAFDTLTDALQATQRMLALTGLYLKNCADRVPRDSQETRELMDNVAAFADSIYSGRHGDAAAALNKIVDLGVEAGTIDPVTRKTKPEFQIDHPLAARGSKKR